LTTTGFGNYIHNMRNITVFSVLVIILFGILSGIAPAAAEETERYSFSVTPRFGILLGKTEEIVYVTSAEYYSDVLSELLWDIKTIFYYGLDIELAPAQPLRQHGVFANVSMKYAIPASSGIMEDRDWTSVANNALTIYSKHDNFVEEIYLIDATAGYSFPVVSLLVLKPALSVSYMHFGFSGMNGYGIMAKAIPNMPGHYYPIGESTDKTIFSGKVISYSQDWLVFSLGFSAEINFLTKFFFKAACNISPLILCVDLDLHIGRRTQFKDYLRWGFYYEPYASLSFVANKWIAVSLYASYRKISGTRGAAYNRYMPANSYFIPEGEAGAGLSLLDTGLAVNIRF